MNELHNDNSNSMKHFIISSLAYETQIIPLFFSLKFIVAVANSQLFLSLIQDKQCTLL